MSNREVDLLVRVQDALVDKPGVIPTATALSHFGEHALGWFALSGAGAVADERRRRRWLALGASAFTARRIRGDQAHRAHPPARSAHPRGRGHAIRLSFRPPMRRPPPPRWSARQTHGVEAPLLGIPVMMLSRMVRGCITRPTPAGGVLGPRRPGPPQSRGKRVTGFTRLEEKTGIFYPDRHRGHRHTGSDAPEELPDAMIKALRPKQWVKNVPSSPPPPPAPRPTDSALLDVLSPSSSSASLPRRSAWSTTPATSRPTSSTGQAFRPIAPACCRWPGVRHGVGLIVAAVGLSFLASSG